MAYQSLRHLLYLRRSPAAERMRGKSGERGTEGGRKRGREGGREGGRAID